LECMETPTLTTPHLILRPASPADIPFILKLFGRPETNQYSEYENIATFEQARKMYELYLTPSAPTQFRLVAELAEKREPVGTIGLYHYSEANRRAEMGYDLLREYWGRGLMAEAVSEVLRYVFEDLKLNRIEATTDTENAASIRVLERAGFIREGLFRERFFYKGGFHDEFFFSLLAEDRARRAGPRP